MVLPLVIAGGAAIGALSEKYSWGFMPNYKDLQTMTTGTDAQLEAQALAMAKSYLITEEGRRNDVYTDSLGILTVGIGHKVTASDNLSEGDNISDSQVDDFFSSDIASAFNAAVSQAKEIDKYNAYMVARLTDVNFQLGTGWRSKFPNTWTLIKSGAPAAVQQAVSGIVKSAWAKQTPNRAIAFAELLKQQFIG